MAKSKSYRKFIATSATATLVATAVAPVAGLAATDFSDVYKLPDEEQEAINYLVEKGVIDGKPGGIFDPYANMKRAEVAKVLVELAGLEESNKSAGFNDVKGHWAEGYINAAADADLMIGKGDGVFDPEAPVKRSEYAQAMVRAYDLNVDEEGPQADFGDIPENYWGTEAIEILFSHGLIKGKTTERFAPEERIQRNHVALMTYRADVKFGVLDLKDVKVENSTTLTVTLSDGSVHEVTLDEPLEPNVETEVTFEIDGNEYTTKVTWVVTDIVVEEVKATTTTVDNTTRGQKLEFDVNGYPANFAQLEQSGYKVEFQANEDVFDTSNGYTSDSGVLNGPKLQALYDNDPGKRNFTYTVVVSKDGDQIESNRQQVNIVDKALGAVSIDSYEVFRGEEGDAEDIKLSSSTLVMGEKYHLDNIAATLPNNVKVDHLPELEDYHVEYSSSNTNAVVVDNRGNLIPVGPGKATVTIKSGTATKAINFTVDNEQRVATNLALATSTAKISTVTNDEYKIGVTVTDQYGDPVFDENLEDLVGTLTDKKVEDARGNVIATITGVDPTKTSLKGKTNIKVVSGNNSGDPTEVKNVGTGTLDLYRQGTSTKLATLKVDTADKGNRADTYKLEGDSTNLKLGGSDATLTLNGYKDNYFVGKGAVDNEGDPVQLEFKTSNDKVVSVDPNAPTNATEVKVTAEGPGKATVEAFSVEGEKRVRLAGVNFTVSDYGTKVAGATFHDVNITSSYNTPIDLEKEIIDKLILASGKSYSYVVDNTGAESVVNIKVAGQADPVGQIRATSTVRDAANTKVDAKFVQGTNPGDPVYLVSGHANDKFDVNDKGSIILRIHTGEQANAPSVASTTINVDVK